MLRFFLLGMVFPTMAFAAATSQEDQKAKPVISTVIPTPTPTPVSTPTPLPKPPPVPAPAFLDVVTFDLHEDGENHRMVVTTGPTQLRIDETNDGYSIIYDPQADHYTGLEHRNYTYWEFSWSEVRAAVANTKRYEAHLRDLNTEGVAGYDQTANAANAASSQSASASLGSDNSGYVWKSTADRKRVAGLDCLRWVGDSVSGESIEAWCTNGPLPQVQTAMEQLRKINEPIALVPVRTMVPPIVFPIYDALAKGGVTPVLITWGGDRDRNHFAFVSAKTRDGKLDLFTVPKLYMKTTLVTMDGITNPAPPVTPIEQKR